MKDFFDLYTLCNQFEFDGDIVRQALQATFERRKTDIPTTPPLALKPEFSEDTQKSMQWKAFVRKGNLDGQSMTLAGVAKRLTDFLMPPARAASEGLLFAQQWSPLDGWTEEY